MERTHSKIPIEQFNKPVFQYFLNKNHMPDIIKNSMNIPGGKRKGVNIFLKKNIPRSIILYQAILYINLGAVIPAKAGIQIEKTGFRIKSGMTKSMKSFVGQDTIR